MESKDQKGAFDVFKCGKATWMRFVWNLGVPLTNHCDPVCLTEAAAKWLYVHCRQHSLFLTKLDFCSGKSFSRSSDLHRHCELSVRTHADETRTLWHADGEADRLSPVWSTLTPVAEMSRFKRRIVMRIGRQGRLVMIAPLWLTTSENKVFILLSEWRLRSHLPLSPPSLTLLSWFGIKGLLMLPATVTANEETCDLLPWSYETAGFCENMFLCCRSAHFVSYKGGDIFLCAHSKHFSLLFLISPPQTVVRTTCGPSIDPTGANMRPKYCEGSGVDPSEGGTDLLDLPLFLPKMRFIYFSCLINRFVSFVSCDVKYCNIICFCLIYI